MRSLLPTSAEVWAVIHARHAKDLRVFSSFSDPSGTFAGGAGTQGRMETEYSLEGSDFPFVRAETTWRIDSEQPHRRLDEKNQYWLCVPAKDSSDE